MRSAGCTAETTPRTFEPAGISTWPFCIRSATVVASKRCSTFAVFELSVVCRRTSISCPAGTTPYALLFTSVGAVFAVVEGVFDVDEGGTYTGALVLPELPLVVAPQATLPTTTLITPTRVTKFFTADIGVSPPHLTEATRRPTSVLCLRCWNTRMEQVAHLFVGRLIEIEVPLAHG